ncbi:unnamed protein product, partial [Rotaria sordida]
SRQVPLYPTSTLTSIVGGGNDSDGNVHGEA